MIRTSDFKNIRLWPIINNAKAFVFEHPELHPESGAYIKYWKEQKKRCIEGFWGNDSKDDTPNWRYASGPLYWYANMWTIKMQDIQQKSEYYTRPLLRDNEWIVFSAILAAQGFSGFEDDENFTCHRLVKKYNDEKNGVVDKKSGTLTKMSKLELRELESSNNIHKPNGDLKEYVEAYEFLKRTHDKPLGRPLYENAVKNLMFLSARAIGKDLEENSIVYTEHGEVKIKDINIGDYIYGADGKLTQVISKTNYYDQQQYLITFQDGRKVECGGGHLWKVNTLNRDDVILETKDLFNNFKLIQPSGQVKFRYSININSCLDFKEKNLPIDPYFIGLWLGDGTSSSACITTSDKEIEDYVKETSLKFNCKYSENIKKGCKTCCVVGTNKTNSFLLKKLQELDLINNKHIPSQYLYGSKDQRLKLVQGLLDSDGYIGKTGAIEFSNKNEKIIKGICFVLGSLGIKYRIISRRTIEVRKGRKIEHKGLNYRIKIVTSENVFKLKRKADRILKNPKQHGIATRSKVSIINIEKTTVKPSVCIGVDNADSLFLTNDFIVTHNSFSISSVSGHEFSFDGLKYYEQVKDLKLQSGVFVGAADGDKSTDLITKIKDGLEQLPGSYGEGEDYTPSPFFKQIKGSFNEGEFIEHAYKVSVGGEWKFKGSKSKIYHGNFGHDTHDAVGRRLTKIIVEEVGELDKIETIHSANERAMKVGGDKFGMELCIGTGGNVKYTVGLKKLFYNPNQYDYYPFQDYWENSGDVGLFIPATYAYNELKDENGNTDLESALEVCVETRNEKAKADTTAPLDFEMMYSPLKISEIFLNPNTNIFPISLIRNRQSELEIRNLFKAKAQFGELEWTSSGDVRWMPDMSLKPITSYYVDERFDLRSCVVIYEHPGDYIKPKYKSSLIKIGYDLVGSENGGSSLASILVYKGLPDIIQDPSEMRNTIVAEYIGRYNNVDDIHEIAIKLAKYYGARILYEDNIPGFLTYCRQKGFLDYLQPTPNVALGEIYKGDFKKGKFGVKMTRELINAADLKTRAWMMTPISHDSEGNIEKFNIDSVYSPRFLDEYINYDAIGNFDHISTFRLIQLWLMDEILQPISATEEVKRENALIDAVLQKRESKINKLIIY